MIRFDSLLDKVRSYSPEADIELLRRAYAFSALEHQDQVVHRYFQMGLEGKI